MLSMAIGVFMRPGRIAFTRIPYLAFPMASACVSAFKAAFDVLYASRPTEQIDAIDEMLTIAPPPCFRITGTACLHARNRKSTRLNSSHGYISYAVFCLKKK